MVKNPDASGIPDATLSPVVVICQLTADGTACDPAVETLARFTTDPAATFPPRPGNSETVRVSESHYIVNWHTKDFDLDPLNTYRICVSVEVDEDVFQGLGHADVDVVETGPELRGVNESLFVGLLNGRTLPIKFRIEQGALTELADPGCAGGPPILL